jgi:putative DNA primase/helicase
MREDFWEFAPTHKIVLATNHKPRVSGQDHALWRRLRLVPFAVRFWNPDHAARPGEDRPGALRQDKELPAKLRAETAGILAWLVEGCLVWQRAGLAAPDAVMAATRAYQEEQDILSPFLAERCVVGGAYRVRAGDLYRTFRAYMEAAGEKYIPSQRRFGEAMSRRGFERSESHGVWYHGLAVGND